jgi:hypothetical protein
MKQYLQEALEESKMNIKHEAATPARKTLFDVDKDSPRLTEEQSDIFHSITAKLLYVATRARMDILLAVGFLATRVSKSTVEDYEKLKRVLEYIKGTMDIEYTLGGTNLTTMRTWIDASFAVHPDMKSHTGGLISYGRGGVGCKSTKQKMTLMSSTHAELAGVSDYLPNTVWATRFMTEQGYAPNENFLEQDNESAIKLEVNGRTSAGTKSRHLDIRYFWIKETLEILGIKTRHCHTSKMLADFLTKPLQGAVFILLRDAILGITDINSIDLNDLLDVLSVEERVEILQQSGRRTDEQENKENDGFILVRGKNKHKKKRVEFNVSETNGEEAMNA